MCGNHPYTHTPIYYFTHIHTYNHTTTWSSELNRTEQEYFGHIPTYIGYTYTYLPHYTVYVTQVQVYVRMHLYCIYVRIQSYTCIHACKASCAHIHIHNMCLCIILGSTTWSIDYKSAVFFQCRIAMATVQPLG